MNQKDNLEKLITQQLNTLTSRKFILEKKVKCGDAPYGIHFDEMSETKKDLLIQIEDDITNCNSLLKALNND